MKARRKLAAGVLALIVSCLFLSGCRDAQEIDDEVYVLALGIDKGITNKIKMTIQYATYKASESGGGQMESKGGEKGKSNEVGGSVIHTIEASTILEGLDLYGMAISRRVSLKHIKLLVFSEEFAKEGVGYYAGPLARYRETRRVMGIAVVKGAAKDFVKENSTVIGESIAKSIELMGVQSDNTSFFPNATFNDFYGGMLSTYRQPFAVYAGINDFKKMEGEPKKESPLERNKGFLPGEIPREGVAKREFAGTALFNGDKMVGSLNSQETRYFMMVTNRFKKGIMALEDPKESEAAIPLDIRLARKPIIKGHFKDEKPYIDVHLEIEGDLGAIQSRIDYEKADMINMLNMQAAEEVKKGIQQVIKKTQELNTDIFGFGHYIAGSFMTIPEWEKYNWLKHYKEAVINVDVNVNIRRTGLLIHSSPIKSAE